MLYTNVIIVVSTLCIGIVCCVMTRDKLCAVASGAPNEYGTTIIHYASLHKVLSLSKGHSTFNVSMKDNSMIPTGSRQYNFTSLRGQELIRKYREALLHSTYKLLKRTTPRIKITVSQAKIQTKHHMSNHK